MASAGFEVLCTKLHPSYPSYMGCFIHFHSFNICKIFLNDFLLLSPTASSEGESEKEGGWREDQEGQAGERESRKGKRGEAQEEPAPWHQRRSPLLHNIYLCACQWTGEILATSLPLHFPQIPVGGSLSPHICGIWCVSECVCVCLCVWKSSPAHLLTKVNLMLMTCFKVNKKQWCFT